MPNQPIAGPIRTFDQNGEIIPADVDVFIDGTSTRADIFEDEALTVPLENPFNTGGQGVIPVFYCSAKVRIEARDEDDVLLPGYPMVAYLARTEDSAASAIDIAPFSGVAGPDLQNALQQIQGNILTTLRTYGIGVTASATLTANLNATNFSSGIERFDATTTGTFPTGVVAADTGLIFRERETSTSGSAILQKRGSARRWYRRFDLGAWAAAWSEIPIIPQSLAAGGLLYTATAGVFAGLAIGATPQVLGVTAGLPAWQLRQPTIATTTATGSTITFTGLAGWDEVRIKGLVTVDIDCEVQVSADNGATWRTTGYLSSVHDSTGFAVSTSGVRANRFGSGPLQLDVSVARMSTTAKTQVSGQTFYINATLNTAGYYDAAGEVHNAVRLIGFGGTANFSVVDVHLYGVR